MRALQLVLKLIVFVVIFFSVSWETTKAQGIGDGVALTITSNVTGTGVFNTDPIMSPAPPYCIINVARSIEYIQIPELNNWSNLVTVDIHIPLREDSCTYAYAIKFPELRAVRSSSAINCTAEIGQIGCGGILTEDGNHRIEIFTDDSSILRRVDDFTNGVSFWWFFLAFRQWHPISIN